MPTIPPPTEADLKVSLTDCWVSGDVFAFPDDESADEFIRGLIRRLAAAEADRDSLLAAARHYLHQYDSVHGVDHGQTPALFRAALAGRWPQPEGEPVTENDELAKLIVTKILVELLHFPHTGAALKRLDRDDHAALIGRLEEAVEAVLEVKRSY